MRGKREKGIFERNREIILKRVEEELSSGFEYLQNTVKRKFGRLMGGILSRVMEEVFLWARKKGAFERAKKIFGYVLDVAEKSKGENLEKVASENINEYIRLHEIARRCPHGHPLRPRLEEMLRREFLARLRIYSPLILSEGENYEQLVKNAFPRKRELEKLVDEQFSVAEEMVELIELDPDVARIPSALKSPLLRLMRASLDSMKEKIYRDIDKIYS